LPESGFVLARIECEVEIVSWQNGWLRSGHAATQQTRSNCCDLDNEQPADRNPIPHAPPFFDNEGVAEIPMVDVQSQISLVGS
jgi:hypothetical protein